jgi:hypothetical protein
LAERMTDEKAKHTILSVAEECDGSAIWAAICPIYELPARAAILVIDAKGS